MCVILVRSLSRRDYLVEALGLKGFSLAYELRTEWKPLCANLWINLGNVIEQYRKCYRTAEDIILNIGEDDLVIGCVGWHKSCMQVANRQLREKKSQSLAETTRTEREVD